MQWIVVVQRIEYAYAGSFDIMKNCSVGMMPKHGCRFIRPSFSPTQVHSMHIRSWIFGLRNYSYSWYSHLQSHDILLFVSVFQQKLAQRKAEIAKMNFCSEHAKKEWKKVLTPEDISSDESGLEEDNDTLVVHQLPWQARAISDLFKQLDNRIWGEKFPLVRRQIAHPLIGQTNFQS